MFLADCTSLLILGGGRLSLFLKHLARAFLRLSRLRHVHELVLVMLHRERLK